MKKIAFSLFLVFVLPSFSGLKAQMITNEHRLTVNHVSTSLSPTIKIKYTKLRTSIVEHPGEWREYHYEQEVPRGSSYTIEYSYLQESTTHEDWDKITVVFDDGFEATVNFKNYSTYLRHISGSNMYLLDQGEKQYSKWEILDVRKLRRN